MLQADIVVADDPGLPNMAFFNPSEEEAATLARPFSASRLFRWTPRCVQAGLARITLEGVNRQVSDTSPMLRTREKCRTHERAQ
jgi:hypothetical protein